VRCPKYPTQIRWDLHRIRAGSKGKGKRYDTADVQDHKITLIERTLFPTKSAARPRFFVAACAARSRHALNVTR
jgi:hypothetical protein